MHTHTHVSTISTGSLDRIGGLPRCRLPDCGVVTREFCEMLLFGGKLGVMYRMALCVTS